VLRGLVVLLLVVATMSGGLEQSAQPLGIDPDRLLCEEVEPPVITPGNVTCFSEDAIVLTARLTEGPWLPAGMAAGFDAGLSRIRARFPQVRDIHARPEVSLTALLIKLRPGTPWLEAWQRGVVETGDAAVDRLLAEYHASGVRLLFNEWFVLEFGQPLRVEAVLDAFRASTAFFVYVEPSSYVGGGPNISFAQLGEERRYTFTEAWGDCPAGCIYKHHWEFAVGPDGAIRLLREYGAPLNHPERVNERAALWP
jgi:hypothetical protein